MATLKEQSYNAAVYDLIDAILTANPSGVQSELQKHGFEFKYGQNAQLAEKYLLQLYQNNTELFWEILDNVKVNPMNIPPVQRERLIALSTSGNPNARFGSLDEYIQGAKDFLKGTKTEGTSEETTTETTTGAYIAYIVIILAIIGTAFYLMKNVKS